MNWIIEFRSGSYLQSDARGGGPIATAMRFDSEEEADKFIDANEWIAFNGGIPTPATVSRHSDLELAARTILRTLPPGSLSAPPGAVTMLRRTLQDLAAAIWQQGWDCRAELSPMASAFGFSNRLNPYRERTYGSERIPAPVDATWVDTYEETCPTDKVANVVKMRGEPVTSFQEKKREH